MEYGTITIPSGGYVLVADCRAVRLHFKEVGLRPVRNPIIRGATCTRHQLPDGWTVRKLTDPDQDDMRYIVRDDGITPFAKLQRIEPVLTFVLTALYNDNGEWRGVTGCFPASWRDLID